MLGFKKDELSKFSFKDLTHPDDFVKITALFDKYQKNNFFTIQVQFRLKMKNLEVIQVLLWGYIYQENSSNRLMGIVHRLDQTFTNAYSNGDVDIEELFSPREKEILQLICKGYTSQEIAKMIFLSERTVHGHRASLLEKTYSKNTASLISFAIRNGYFVA